MFSTISVYGQLYMGNDFGFISYDVKDEVVSPFRFETVTPSLINFGIFYTSPRSKLAVKFGKDDIRLERLEKTEDNFLEGQNYELDIEYFRNVYSVNDQGSFFIGLAHNGHFSYYDHIFKTDYVTVVQSTHEMTAANITLSGLVEYQLKELTLQYKAGIGILSYGTRPKNETTAGDFYFGWQDYFSFQNSIIGLVPVSARVLIKPEFRLKYYTYSNPEPMKTLKQSFLVGVYIRL